MSEASLPIVIRQAVPSDTAMVTSSWKHSSFDQQSALGRGAYFVLANALCAEVLSGNPLVLVATPPDSPELILGWVCGEASPEACVLFWCYVKSAYRRDRIATRLVQACTAMTVAEGAGPGKVHTMHTRHEPVLARHGWEHRSLHKALLHRASGSLTGSAKRGTVTL